MFNFNKIIYREKQDEQLMALIRTGDRKAFEVLYGRYFDKLVWFAKGYVDLTPKAEDAVQEVFLKIIEKPWHFDETKRFSTWVYTVTGNVCKNMLRNEQNRLRLLKENAPRDHHPATIRHRMDERILNECIQVVLSGLSEKEKNIFSLRFQQELSIREISAILDIAEGSVKSCLYYLLKKFASQLKDFQYEK